MTLSADDFSRSGDEWETRKTVGDYGPGGGSLSLSLDSDADTVPDDLLALANNLCEDIAPAWDAAIEFLDADTWEYYTEEMGGGTPHIHAITIRSADEFALVIGFPRISDVIIFEFEDGEPVDLTTVG